jgi:hypothetical protein
VTAKLTLDARSLEARVGSAVGELVTATETLQGLATTLEAFHDTNARSDAEELRQAAIGIRASAVQTLLTACTVVGLSERFATFARVHEMADANSDGGDDGA